MNNSIIPEIIWPHFCITKQVCCATAVTLLDLGVFCDKVPNPGYLKACPLSVKQQYKEIWLMIKSTQAD